MISLPYLITSIIVILLPGPGSIYTVSTAMNNTKEKSIIAALGCTVGIVPHLCLGILAMFMMHQLPDIIMNLIKLFGAMYLIYLGYKMLTDSGKITLSTTSKDTKSSKLFYEGILLNLLNPKLTLFFISFLPQYLIQNHSSYILQTISLGLVFMLLTLLVFVCYGVLANELRKRFLSSTSRMSWINKIFGILFILFAFKLYI